MVRKLAAFAFGLALVVALGLALAHAESLTTAASSTGFSRPCLPASPVFKAAGESRGIPTIDPAFALDKAVAPGGLVLRSGLETVGRTAPRPAPGVYAPLFDRPPPRNS